MNIIDNSELGHQAAPTRIWDLIKTTIECDRGEKSFEIWFNAVEVVSFEDSILTLSHPFEFVRKLIEAQFLPKIKQAIKNEYNHDVDVTIVPPIGSADELLIHKWNSYRLAPEAISVYLSLLAGDSEKLEFANFLDRHMQTYNAITEDEILDGIFRIRKKRPVPPLRETKIIGINK